MLVQSQYVRHQRLPITEHALIDRIFRCDKMIPTVHIDMSSQKTIEHDQVWTVGKVYNQKITLLKLKERKRDDYLLCLLSHCSKGAYIELWQFGVSLLTWAAHVLVVIDLILQMSYLGNTHIPGIYLVLCHTMISGAMLTDMALNTVITVHLGYRQCSQNSQSLGLRLVTFVQD